MESLRVVANYHMFHSLISITLLPTNLIVMHVSASKREANWRIATQLLSSLGGNKACYKKLLSRLHLGTPCLRQTPLQHLREAVYLVNLVIIKRR